MASQVRAKTVRDILDALGENELPFHLDGGCIERSRRHAQLLHWVSNRGQGFAANARVTADHLPRGLVPDTSADIRTVGAS